MPAREEEVGRHAERRAKQLDGEALELLEVAARLRQLPGRRRELLIFRQGEDRRWDLKMEHWVSRHGRRKGWMKYVANAPQAVRACASQRPRRGR